MSSTAYCVGYMDVSDPKNPKYMGCGIFSEPTPSTTSGRFVFLIHQASGVSYGDAVRNLERALLDSTYFAWAWNTLQKRQPPPTTVVGGGLPPPSRLKRR